MHLAGAGIGDHRWTDEYKLEILRSRTKSTVLLAGALADLAKPPSVLVSGSAIGFYGDRGDELLDEASPAGTGFLPEVCVAWEAATVAAEEAGIRVAHIRTGIVLSGQGGALEEAAPAVQGRRRRQARLRPAVAELDLDRGRGRRHPPPADRGRPRGR